MARTFENGVWTSEVAAEMAEGFRQRIEDSVLAYLIDCGGQGAIDQEIQAALEIDGNSERPARLELVKRGLAKDSGRWRYTMAKRPAIVWVATKQGRAS